MEKREACNYQKDIAAIAVVVDAVSRNGDGNW